MDETPQFTATAAAYDGIAETYATCYRDSLATRPLDRGFIAAFADLVRGRGPVLDAGCGPGHGTEHLRRLGLDVAGVDLAPRMVELARRGYPEIAFERASLTRLPHADGAFAGVMAWYSLIHLPPASMPVALAELRRVLAPGGHLVLAFQAHDDPATAHVPFDHKVTPGFRWSLDGLGALVEETGLVEAARLITAAREGELYKRGHLLYRRP
ncbi:methyltransferase family protein [Actinocorallia herbida]|uniref:Methyltransferase family protein n=1 Tax=Actinocorallia herbida TaxID=58109 RepID=A0A3N1D592_9ACTN|nr:class I SAM-dependent methyltransferase [Actinocorallia herbida]ROO88694.1 methyltransferase family protein [Actinocorallia herbida]